MLVPVEPADVSSAEIFAVQLAEMLHFQFFQLCDGRCAKDQIRIRSHVHPVCFQRHRQCYARVKSEAVRKRFVSLQLEKTGAERFLIRDGLFQLISQKTSITQCIKIILFYPNLVRTS